MSDHMNFFLTIFKFLLTTFFFAYIPFSDFFLCLLFLRRWKVDINFYILSFKEMHVSMVTELGEKNCLKYSELVSGEGNPP